MRKRAYNSAPESADRGLPAPRIAENGYRLPDPLPAGLVLTDSRKRQWLLGKSIGCGGFGEIYCAKELPESFQHKPGSAGAANNSRSSEANNSYNGLPKRRCVQKFVEKQITTKNKEQLNKLCRDANYPFVVKVDHLDGPLYPEMHFYHRVAKPKLIDNWMLTHRLAFLGMPRHVGSGIVEHNVAKTCRRYRFLVMDRLGIDLQKILNKQGNRLGLKTAYTITMMTLDILAYIHSFGYIHADIKASNLLLGMSIANQLLDKLDSFFWFFSTLRPLFVVVLIPTFVWRYVMFYFALNTKLVFVFRFISFTSKNLFSFDSFPKQLFSSLLTFSVSSE